MKAIVIAAGQGARLRPYTADRPKCMVDVSGKSILHWQVEAFRRAGIEDIVVIHGYKGGTINVPGVRLVHNKTWHEHQILMSLFSAWQELTGEVVISYGDIVYHPDIVSHLVQTPTSGTLVVDQAWEKIYTDRHDHPVEQAELCRLAPTGLVTRVGKQVGPEGAFGEFIGLCRFSAPMMARLASIYWGAVAQGPERPFGLADSLYTAYLSDLLNVAIEREEAFAVLAIEGGWREIDTVEDYERVRELDIDW